MEKGSTTKWIWARQRLRYSLVPGTSSCEAIRREEAKPFKFTERWGRLVSILFQEYIAPTLFSLKENRNVPLIALQYHEVKFNITFRQAADCYIVSDATASPSLSNASLFVDYIYLDTDERRQFSQVQHEYLLSKRKKVTTLARADTVLRKKCMYSAQPNVLPVVYCC